MSLFHAVLIVAIAALLATACAPAPERAAAPSQARLEAALLRSPRHVDDPDLANWLRKATARIAPAGPALRVHVIDEAMPQADLLGPGLVRVNLGLLRELASEAEALFVLAHEIGHRDLGHLKRRGNPAWDPEAAEFEADRWARQRLVALELWPGTGARLLDRLARDSRWPGAQAVLRRRAAALSAPADAGDASPPAGSDGFLQVMARHRVPSP